MTRRTHVSQHSYNMNKLTKAALAVTTTAALLMGGGVAYGYWSAVGAGTGTAATASAGAALTVQQVAPTTQLVPGGSVNLQGTITNPNTFDVAIQNMTAAIESVTPAAGKTCAASNYSLATALYFDASMISKSSSIEWMGVTLSMADATTNQDGCKGATVKVAYTVL